MDGIDKIVKKIELDAESEAKNIISEARAKAAESICVCRERAEQIIGGAEKRAKNAAEEFESRAKSAAELRAGNIILAKKREIMQKAFNSAHEKLCGLTGERYAEVLTALAIRGLKDGGQQLIFSPKDRQEYGKRVVEAVNSALAGTGIASVELSDKTRDIRGGVIISDGNVETNCSFEMLVYDAASKMQIEVAQILFD